MIMITSGSFGIKTNITYVNANTKIINNKNHNWF